MTTTGGGMDDETLLGAIYRGRPTTIVDLAALAHLDAASAQAAVARLGARGLLGGDDDEITYLHPATWAAEAVAERSAELRRSSREALVGLEQIVADLPTMLRHWSVGDASGGLVPVVTRHGPHASEDLWFETARHDAGTLNAVLPDIARFSSGDERAARFGRALVGKEAVRVIIPSWAVNDPTAQLQMKHYGAAGVDYRLLDEPPSWFWVDGDQVAFPFEWGEARPTSVLGVRNGAIAGMALQYFESLWRVAEPATPAAHSWGPLLVLMRQGITLETASRQIGINPRTGRRRIAAAMTHYGVSTLFALGVAWAAEPEVAGAVGSVHPAASTAGRT